MLAVPVATSDFQIHGSSLGVLSAWAGTAFCGTSSSSSFASQGHGADTAAETAVVSETPASSPVEETSNNPSNISSSSAQPGSEDLFHFVPLAQRRQKPLPTTDSVFLWSRSEEQARLGKLIKVRVGKSGLTRSFLARCGDLLAAHEIVRVSDYPPEGASLDTIIDRVRNRVKFDTQGGMHHALVPILLKLQMAIVTRTEDCCELRPICSSCACQCSGYPCFSNARLCQR